MGQGEDASVALALSSRRENEILATRLVADKNWRMFGRCPEWGALAVQQVLMLPRGTASGMRRICGVSMDDSLAYKNLEKTSESHLATAQEALTEARKIYLDLIKLVISISVGSIPLIGLLLTNSRYEMAAALIKLSLLSLAVSLAFGIAALINHALSFKRDSDAYFGIVQKLFLTGEKGPEEIRNYFSTQRTEFLKTKQYAPHLNYIYSIAQLICFSYAIALLLLTIHLVVK